MDITAAILRMSEKGSRKTHIMYGAKLSYKLLLDYLASLTSEGLLRKEGDLYVTTEKGLEFLEGYDRLKAVPLVKAKAKGEVKVAKKTKTAEFLKKYRELLRSKEE